MNEILTIVVTYNGKKWAERCIGSALASAVPTDVMVVDNASEDGTAEWIREHFPEVILVEKRENLGFAAANNIGFGYALQHGYSYVYLLNQDAWVFPETLGTLVRAFEESTGTPPPGILSPMQMEANLVRMDEQFRKHCAKALSNITDETVRVPFVMAAHWMVSRACLEATGGFAPEFPHYGEDNNYIQRAAYHGFSAAVVKTASAVHDRADRPRPKDYRMKLKVVAARVAVANPRGVPFLALLGQSVLLALQGVLHFSTIPWKGIGTLWTSYVDLRRCRAASRQRGAFLPSTQTME